MTEMVAAVRCEGRAQMSCKTKSERRRQGSHAIGSIGEQQISTNVYTNVTVRFCHSTSLKELLWLRTLSSCACDINSKDDLLLGYVLLPGPQWTMMVQWTRPFFYSSDKACLPTVRSNGINPSNVPLFGYHDHFWIGIARST